MIFIDMFVHQLLSVFLNSQTFKETTTRIF